MTKVRLDPDYHVLPPRLLAGKRPLGHRDAVRAWEERLGNPAVELVCEESDVDGEPCRTKIGCIFNGDDAPGPLVQTFISDQQGLTGGNDADDVVGRTRSTAASVWFLDDDGAAGWRGPYTTRCVVNHRHLLDERGRSRLQAAVREGLREVAFTSNRCTPPRRRVASRLHKF